MFRQVLPALPCARAWRRLLIVLLFVVPALPLMAQVCPSPGNLVTGPGSGIVNNYYAGNGNLAVGATSLTLGTLDSRGLSTPLAVGDLLMIIQMQDASINSANNNTYGGASGTGSGSTSVGRSGQFEFVRVVTAGASPVFTPPLTNSYVQSAASGLQGQRTYQVIRAMQYSSLTATGITAPPWNGTTGGVVSVDVRDTLTLGSGTVETIGGRSFFVAGKGFRGGAGVQLGGNFGTSGDYATLSTDNTNGSKGEGIAGTPIQSATLSTSWTYSTTNPPTLAVTTGPAEGYPGGSYARGAPANAGGGGTDGRDARNSNDENAGGGGGGNYGPGGTGGRPWNDPLKDTGGRGGAGYAGTLAFNRVFMGGGGGAGGTNNGTNDTAAYVTNQAAGCGGGAGICSSGAAGGGIVIIRARLITGGGVIDVRGAHAYNVANDAGGGGGGGGAVVIQTSNGGNASIDATGGDGGNAWAGSAGGLGGRHGPGGAGGGGFIAYSPVSMSLSAAVNGGAPGRTMSDLANENYGSTGYNGGLTAFLAPNIPGAPPAAQCDPNLSLVKGNGVSTLTSGSTTTYTLTVSNAGLGPTGGTVTVSDKLPAGLTVVPGVLPVGGPNAASWACTAANTTDITCTSTSAIPGLGSSTFAFAASVTPAGTASLVNRAIVKGGGDPNKPLAATPADGVTAAAACTGADTPAGCALDTDSVVAPNLVLTKTDGTTTLVEGGTTTYTLVATNNGSTPTSGTITMVEVLPAGLTFAGTSPFTTNSFTCTLAAPNLVCERTAALAAGASATISFSATVDATAPSSVINLARIGGGGDPSPLKSTPTAASVTSCVAPVPPANTSSDPNTGCAADTNGVLYITLELTKDDGQPFAAQNGFTDYVLVVSNIGTAPTYSTVTVRDVLPAPMTFVGAATPFTPTGVNGANWSCVRNSTSDVSCSSTVAIPAGGNSSFILPASVGAAAVGAQLTNRARVGGGGDISAGMATVPTNASVTACISHGNGPGCATDLDTVQNAPEIRLSKSHPNPQVRSPGDTFNFNLIASNNGGTGAAVNTVRVVDVVPAGLTINSVTPGTPFTCGTAGQVVTCNNTLGVLSAGSTTVAITVNVTVAAGATNTLVNRAMIGGTSSGDPQNNVTPTTALTANCIATEVPYLGCAADIVPLTADLQITKVQRQGTSGPFTAALPVVPTGSTVQFLLTASNTGPSSVSTATLADSVPTNFTNVSWTCGVLSGAASCGTASGTGNAISLTVSLSGASSIAVTVTALATGPTTAAGVINTASITAPVGITEATTTNNVATLTTSIGVTNLVITKTDGTTTIAAGATTSYTITVSNTGDFPANGARLYDPVATGLQCPGPPVCNASGPATACPAGLTAAQLNNATPPAGVALDTFGAGGSLTITLACGVSATGF